MATLTGNLIITLLVVILLADHSFALHCTQLVILPLKNSLCKVESVTTHLCVSLPVSPELYLCFSINICYSSPPFFLKIHSSVLVNKNLEFLTPRRLEVTANSPVSLWCKIVRRWPKQEGGGGTWAKDLVSYGRALQFFYGGFDLHQDEKVPLSHSWLLKKLEKETFIPGGHMGHWDAGC